MLKNQLNTIRNLMFLGLALAGTAQAGPIWDSLTDAEKRTVGELNGQVQKSQKVADSKWPRFTVVQKIEASADEVAAVMFDYPTHALFFPNITRSQPEVPWAATTRVNYTMKLPAVWGIELEEENYTVLDVMKKTSFGYQLNWTMVAAQTLKNTEGEVLFEEFKGGAMVIRYMSLISPSQTGASVFTRLAEKSVSESVRALEARVLDLKASKPEVLNKAVSELKQAVK